MPSPTTSRSGFSHAGRTLRLALVAGFACFAAAPPSAAALALADARPAAQQGDPKAHKHAWVKQTRKEWVPPETKRVQVGVDAKGRPIYEVQVVKPGYWKTVSYYRCSCGATRS